MENMYEERRRPTEAPLCLCYVAWCRCLEGALAYWRLMRGWPDEIGLVLG